MRPPCSSRRSISARASVDLPLPDRPVKNSTRPWRSGAGRSASTMSSSSASGSPRVDQADDRVAAGVGRDDLHPERVVGLGVAVRGERARRRRSASSARPRRAGWRAAARRGTGRGCRGRPGRAGRPGPRPRSWASWASVSGAGDGHERAPGVAVAHLGGGEVEAAERAVLGGRQRLDPRGCRRPRGGPAPAGGPRGRPARPSARRPARAAACRVIGVPGGVVRRQRRERARRRAARGRRARAAWGRAAAQRGSARAQYCQSHPEYSTSTRSRVRRPCLRRPQPLLNGRARLGYRPCILRAAGDTGRRFDCGRLPEERTA